MESGPVHQFAKIMILVQSIIQRASIAILIRKKGAAEIIIFFLQQVEGEKSGGGLSAMGTHGQKEA